jgi:hypothetical protein
VELRESHERILTCRSAKVIAVPVC